jgi:His Kinase A (phospho-acceptor) domain
MNTRHAPASSTAFTSQTRGRHRRTIENEGEKGGCAMFDRWAEGRCLVGHDLNNDLNVVLGRCELLKEHLRGDPKAEEHLQALAEAARRMAARVADACFAGAAWRSKGASG